MSKNRVWLYRRAVNSRNSADILLVQKRGLEAYAQEHGFEIAGRSGDVGNGRLSELPGLLKFYAAMEQEKVDILLLYNLSCLGSDPNEVSRYWRILRKHSIRLCTVAEGEVYLDMRSLFSELFGQSGCGADRPSYAGQSGQ